MAMDCPVCEEAGIPAIGKVLCGVHAQVRCRRCGCAVRFGYAAQVVIGLA